MKYHQIEAFYHVMLTGSISQAAKNLGRTQPAVSMTINTLEDLLGTRLFDRHAGRLSIRAEAHVLFEQVGPVMRQLQDIRTRFGGLSDFAVPRQSIITANNPGIQMIPAAIAPLAAQGQEFRLMNGTAAMVVSEIENQRHDLGITDEGPAQIQMTSPLYEAEVFELPVCALYPAGLLGSVGRSVSLSQIGQHPVSTLYAQHGMASELRAALPPSRVEFESLFPMACNALATGNVAIVDIITCQTIKTLLGQQLPADFRVIEDAVPARYFLLRPRYRPRSNMGDRTYEAVRTAFVKIQTA